MTREEEIRARLEKATPGPWKVHMDDVGDEEECMVSTGIQDLTGYSIVDSDGGLLPWTGERMYSESDANAEFISNAPSDVDYLLKHNQRMAEALKRIIHRSSLAQKQLDRREEPSNIPWDVSYFRGKATAWNDAETIARQALEVKEWEPETLQK